MQPKPWKRQVRASMAWGHEAECWGGTRLRGRGKRSQEGRPRSVVSILEDVGERALGSVETPQTTQAQVDLLTPELPQPHGCG